MVVVLTSFCLLLSQLHLTSGGYVGGVADVGSSFAVGAEGAGVELGFTLEFALRTASGLEVSVMPSGKPL